MIFRYLALLSLLCPWSTAKTSIHVYVNTTTSIATVDERFVSYTLDWWPPKGGCPEGWGPKANAMTVDLKNSKLLFLTRALGPSILRIGGSLDKVVTYNVPGGDPCRQNNVTSRPSSINNQTSMTEKFLCLTTTRWDALHDFARSTNSMIVFGLSYPQLTDQGLGAWNSSQAEALFRYSRKKNYSYGSTLYGVELAEELSSTFSVESPSFARYVDAYHQCAKLLQSIWPHERPKLMGPCPSMNWPTLATWIPAFLQGTRDVLDIAVFHSYNQIQVATSNDTTQPSILYLNDTIPSGNVSTQQGSSPGGTGWQAVAMRQFVDNLRYSGGSPNNKLPDLWLGEFGPHNGGGGHGTFSFTFASSFGYLDTLGHLARLNHKVLARQTLVGGNYELLRCTSGYLPGGPGCDFEPHVDYWVALLWTRLMGTTVLHAPTIQAASFGVGRDDTAALRFHAHCTAAPRKKGAITMALSNMSTNTTFVIPASALLLLGGTRVEYILQAHQTNNGMHRPSRQGDFDEQKIELNGAVLTVGNATGLPSLKGNAVKKSEPFEIPPVTLGFVVFHEAQAGACIPGNGKVVKTVFSKYRSGEVIL